MKRILSLLLAVLFVISLLPAAFAAGTGIDALKINPYGGEEPAIDTVSWYAANGAYFLFLPADADPAAARVYFTASGAVTLDGEPVLSGGGAAAFTEGAHTLACGNAVYPLTVCYSANVPAVYLTTESGSLTYLHQDKENKEPGSIRVYENGEMTLDKELKQIKGRGNSTWTSYPKKPYNMKFDKKTALLGMPKAKKWTLLANYFDYSLIHSVFAWEFANVFGLPYTSEYRHVDLYINGNYMGNYVICESVEIADNRIEINDLEKATEDMNPDLELDALPRAGTGENGAVQSYGVKGSRKWAQVPEDPADITGGYLLEYEYGARYDAEPCGFVTFNGQPIVIKSPEFASEAEVNYIADFVDAGTEALYSPTGYNAAGRHYSEYFDVESLVNMYMLQELSMNYDAAFSSFYAFKPEGESKLVFAPVWDMDNAFGSRSANLNVPLTTTDLWWANQMAYNGILNVLAAANRHAEIREAARARWQELRATEDYDNVYALTEALSNALAESAAMNALRWNHFSTTDYAVAAEKWRANADVSLSFVQGRTAALDRGLGENGAYVFYDLNGSASRSWALVSPIREIGETLTVRAYTGNGSVHPPEGKTFGCWNTAPDGSGVTYMPGDTLTITNEETVLYAIWVDATAPETPEEPGEPEEPETGSRFKQAWERVLDFFRRIIRFIRGLLGL